AAPVLIDALKDIPSSIQRDAAQTLGDYGPSVMPGLILALKRPEAPVRAGAAKALGYVRPKTAEAVPALALALRDNQDEVRESAAFALSRIGKHSKAAVPELALALKDKQGWVRAWAAETLQRIGPDAKPAVPALVESIRNKEEANDRSIYVEALAAIGPGA